MIAVRRVAVTHLVRLSMIALPGIVACGSTTQSQDDASAYADASDAWKDAPGFDLPTDGAADGTLDAPPTGPIYDAGGPLTHATGDCVPPCGAGEFCYVVHVSGGPKAPPPSSPAAGDGGGDGGDAGKSLGCHALPPQCQQGSCNCLVPQLLPYCTSNGGFANETCTVEEDGVLTVTCNISLP
jgi:hypothetical protein